MDQKSGTDAWNRAGMERFCLEQLQEGKSGTDAWNRAGTEILYLEQLHGKEVWNRCMEQSWNGNTHEQTHRTHGTWNGS